MVSGWTVATLSDFLIAITVCYYLHKFGSGQSVGSRTEHIINRLILYSINTGLFASLFSIATLILYLRLPNSLAFTALLQVQSKLYPVCLLASLNARKTLSESAKRSYRVFTDASAGTLQFTYINPYNHVGSTSSSSFRNL